MNDLDRFHLLANAIDRLPSSGASAALVKQSILAELVEHKRYIAEALEPAMVTADDASNPELAEMARRFWMGLAPARGHADSLNQPSTRFSS